jgi:hypothetical protein
VNEGEVYFALKGDYDFDPGVVTQRLGIEPTRVMRKADPRPKITSWMLSSGKVVDDVVDVYAMSSKLVSRLAGSSESIKQLMAELNLSAVLQIVLRITMDDSKSMPAIGFDEGTIKFLSNVGASIDVDTYRK